MASKSTCLRSIFIFSRSSEIVIFHYRNESFLRLGSFWRSQNLEYLWELWSSSRGPFGLLCSKRLQITSSWSQLGSLPPTWSQLRPNLSQIGANFAPTWTQLGAILGLCCLWVGSSWAHVVLVGTSWSQEAFLEPPEVPECPPKLPKPLQNYPFQVRTMASEWHPKASQNDPKTSFRMPRWPPMAFNPQGWSYVQYIFQ